MRLADSNLEYSHDNPVSARVEYKIPGGIRDSQIPPGTDIEYVMLPEDILKRVDPTNINDNSPTSQTRH